MQTLLMLGLAWLLLALATAWGWKRLRDRIEPLDSGRE